MLRFLGPAWLDALARAVASLGPDRLAQPLVVQHEITGPDGGADVFHLRFGPGPSTAGAGAAESPDVRFVCDLDTAEALQRGELSAALAVLHGRLAVRGDATRLVGLEPLWADLAAATAALRDATSWPSAAPATSGPTATAGATATGPA